MASFFIQKQKPSKLRSILFALILAPLLSACEKQNGIEVLSVSAGDRLSEQQLAQFYQTQQVDDHQSPEIYYFGFDRRVSVKEETAQYLPFLNYLSKATGYQFKLHITPQNHKLVDEFGNGTTQFAAMGALGFLEARSQFNTIPLVRGVNGANKAEYRSFFVVRPESEIKTLQDLSGYRLALGDKSSTQGHLIPRITLNKYSLSLADFTTISYTGSHLNCAETVLAGRADACAMQDTLAMSYVEKGLLRIIHKSEFYPSSGIVASNDVEQEIIDKVKAALLDFQPVTRDAKLLYDWHRTEMPLGFIVANNDDYAVLNKWAVHFGFINLDNE